MVCELLFSAFELHLELVELVFEVCAGGLPGWFSNICTHQLLSTCSTHCIAEFSNCLSWVPPMAILCCRMPRLRSKSSITPSGMLHSSKPVKAWRWLCPGIHDHCTTEHCCLCCSEDSIFEAARESNKPVYKTMHVHHTFSANGLSEICKSQCIEWKGSAHADIKQSARRRHTVQL